MCLCTGILEVSALALVAGAVTSYKKKRNGEKSS
jgi:hypothetical protein